MKANIENLRTKKKNLEALQEHPGWKDLVGTLDEQISARRQVVFSNPIRSLDDAFRTAGQQGEIAGLQGLQVILAVKIQDLAQDIRTLLAEEREQEGE